MILQEVIGKGSYGVVCSAVDSKTGEKVAIKKINNVFDHVSDATRILREIKLLRLLRHPGRHLLPAGGGTNCQPASAVKLESVGMQKVVRMCIGSAITLPLRLTYDQRCLEILAPIKRL